MGPEAEKVENKMIGRGLFRKVPVKGMVLTFFIVSLMNIPFVEAKEKNKGKVAFKNPMALINQALKDGGIDEETALIYKHYVLFRPQRLPDKFKVDNPYLVKCGTPFLDEVQERWDLLNPGIRRKLSSIYEIDERGISPKNDKVPYLPYAHATAKHFVIYYELDPNIDNRAPLNDNDWQFYTDTNGNGKWDKDEPLNDDVGIDGLPNTGDSGEGDGKPNPAEAFEDNNGNGTWDLDENYLDVYNNGQWDLGEPRSTPDYVEDLGNYLEQSWDVETGTAIGQLGYVAPPLKGRMKIHIYSMGAYGVTFTDPMWGLPENVSEIGIDNDMIGVPRNDDPEGIVKGAMKVTATHELFHTIHNNSNVYDGREDRWFKEVTATWMEDEVYNMVNDYVNYYDGDNYAWFKYPHVSLNFDTIDINHPNYSHKYGSSIFAKYLSEKYGGVDIIKTIWEKCKGRTQSLKATTVALGGETNFKEVFKNFTTTNFIEKHTTFIDSQYNYEDDAAPSYPDMHIEVTYPLSADSNQHFVGKEPLPTEYGDRLYMLDDKELPHLSSHYLKFTPPEQLDKPTKLYLNFKQGPGGSKDWGSKIVLVMIDGTKVITEMVEKEKGYFIFKGDFGFTLYNPKPNEIREVVFIPTNLDQISNLRKYQYSGLVIPQFEDAYKNLVSVYTGTTSTVFNFDSDNDYKSGDTIHLEINLSYKAKITADFSEVDSNFDSSKVKVELINPYHYIYEIVYTLNSLRKGYNLPVTIKAEDLTKTDFNLDRSFKINPPRQWFWVMPAYMLSGESAVASLHSFEDTPVKTIKYSPAKITQQLIEGTNSFKWGPERFITLTNKGKNGAFFLYEGTINPTDYVDGYYNDGSGSGELYYDDNGIIRKCSLGIYNILPSADIIIENISSIFQKVDGPYVTVTGYFRQLGTGMWAEIFFINYDEYLWFAQSASITNGKATYGWELGPPKYGWVRGILDVKLHEGNNLIQIYNGDFSIQPELRDVGASVVVSVPYGVYSDVSTEERIQAKELSIDKEVLPSLLDVENINRVYPP